MEKVRVSVIMSVYNQRNPMYLERSVRSILNQTLSDLELLIYDDGSDRGTAEILRKTAGIDSRIRLIRGERNKGLSHGLNTCIAAAKGEYLARMDDDDISLPERLERQVEFLENHPEYGFVGCNAWLMADGGVWGRRRRVERPGEADFLKHSPYIHPAVVFRREVFERFGGYDVSKKIGRSEDYELFMRLHKNGCRGYNLQEELFQYREDRNGYQKRRLRYRLDECAVRAKGFSGMRLPWHQRFVYCLKPLFLGLLPIRLYGWLKRRAASFRGKDGYEAA